MIAKIGFYCLLLALMVCAYGVVCSLLGAGLKRRKYIESSKNAVFVMFALLSLSAISLLYNLATHNFSLEYVANYTSNDLPLFYTLSALWAGQEGSLLFWEWLLGIFAVLVVVQNRTRNQKLLPFVISVIMGVSFFFLTVIIFTSNPFEISLIGGGEGRGLNPLLQNPGMVIHPPTLYLGYVGFTIPFAFGIGALATGKLDDEWIKSTRRWTLSSWLFLGLGVLFGAQWAYVVLGWGGYWAWDPVENASLMPWLTATAYLHSVMIQEKRGMLKVWNILLVSFTFILSVFGTFLTRSGILSSVHAFGASSTIGCLFLGFMGGIIFLAVALLFKRLPQLKSENELNSLLSRESSFLINNVVFLGITFAVFWGTVFPLISEAVRGVKVSVGPSFFNKVIPPIGLTLLALTGICPLIPWRRTSGKSLRKNFLLPGIAAASGAIFSYIMGIQKIYPLICTALVVFVIFSIGSEFARGVRVRMRVNRTKNPLKAFYFLVTKNRRRYGGFIVHIGIVLIILGITGAAYNVEKQFTLRQGERVKIQEYELANGGTLEHPSTGKLTTKASVPVYQGSELITTLHPAKSFHPNYQQTVSEAAIYSTLKEDVYITLLDYFPEDKLVSIKVGVFPLVSWIWIGGVILLAGGAVAMWPQKKI